MDEENNVDSTERQMKKIGKDIARKTKNETLHGIKKIISAFLKFSWKKLLIILCAIGIILFIVLSVSSWFVIKDKLFSDSSSIVSDITSGESEDEGDVKKLVKIDGRKLVLDTEEFNQRIEKWFENNNQKPGDFGISGDYKELKAFLAAEILTMYPDLRTRTEIENDVQDGANIKKKILEQNELQGCVKFRRMYNNGTEQYLEYMPYNEFSTIANELGITLDTGSTSSEIHITTDEQLNAIKNKYGTVKDKFSLDSEMNALFITLSTNTTKTSISGYAQDENYTDNIVNENICSIKVIKVNYQSMLTGFTMPFELNMAFLMTTESAEFCTSVADLALNSNIIFNVMDSVVTEDVTKVYSYHSHLKTHKDFTFTRENNGNKEENIRETFTKEIDNGDVKDYQTIKKSGYTTTTKVALTYVDTWISHFDYQYSNKVEGSENEENTYESTEPDDEEYKVVGNHHGITDFPTGPVNGVPEGYTYSNIKEVENTEKIEERKTDKKWTITEKRLSNTYEADGERIVKFAPTRFLSLLKVDPDNINEKTGEAEFNLYEFDKNKIQYYESVNSNSSAPLEVMYRTFFFRLIKKNNKTKDLAEKLAYIFDLYDGNAEWDENKFSDYPPGDPVPGGPGGPGYPGGDVREKLWWAIKDLFASKGIENDVAVASALGNTSAESGFKPNNLENDANAKSGYSDEKFTELVDNRSISKEEFLSKMEWSPYPNLGGIYGYGLAQWTAIGRKNNLWGYTIDSGKSIADTDAQISYLINELPGNWNVGLGFAKWTSIYADDSDPALLQEKIREATQFYCKHFEVGGWSENRYTAALSAYNDFHNKQRPSDPENPIDPNAPVSEKMKALLNLAVDICNDPDVTYLMVAGSNRGPKTFDCSGFAWYLYYKCFNFDIYMKDPGGEGACRRNMETKFSILFRVHTC